MIAKISHCIFLLYSVALACGKFNPFKSPDGELEGGDSLLVSVLLVLFLLLTLFNRQVVCNMFFLKKYIVVLFCFLMVICFSGLVYQNQLLFVESLLIYLKLFICFLSFILVSLYLMEYKEIFKLSFLFFSLTIFVLVFLVQMGLLDYAYRITNGRMSLFGENANSTSTRVVVACIFFMYFILEDTWRKGLRRYILVIPMLSLILYIFQSGSRGSFISLAISIIVMIYFSSSAIKTKMIFSSILFFSVLFLFSKIDLSEFTLLERIDELEEGNPRSFLMECAFNIYLDHPVLGVGINGYTMEKIIRLYPSLDSHCIVTSILAMSGTIGIILFFLLWYNLFCISSKVINKTILPMVLLITIILVSLKTGGVLVYLFMWHIFSVICAMSYNVSSENDITNI